MDKPDYINVILTCKPPTSCIQHVKLTWYRGSFEQAFHMSHPAPVLHTLGKSSAHSTIMSDLKVDGFKVCFASRLSSFRLMLRLKSSQVLDALGKAFEGFSETEKKAQLQKVWSFYFPSFFCVTHTHIY